MPPPLHVPKPGLGRQMPPAAFTPVLGLFGLGLAWRAGSDAYGFGSGVADLILGAVTLLFLAAAALWLSKPLRRPSVIWDELRVLPGQAGVAAASMSVMLLAASLAPFATRIAGGLAILAFVLHLGLLGLWLLHLRDAPDEARRVTPVFHLYLVGFILGGNAANALGAHDLARALVWAMLLPAGVVWGLSLRQLRGYRVPAPLRPMLAIHVVPACMFASVAHGAGLTTAAHAFLALAVVIVMPLIIFARWLTEAGFTPFWGAFTFPIAALATALITVSGGQGVMGLMGGLVLVAGTLVIPAIAYRVLKDWPGGRLAARTHAAEA